MGFTKNFRTPVQLTAAARASFATLVNAYLTAALLPTVASFDISYDFGITESALPAAASFRSFNTESDVATATTTERRSGKLPPISRRLHVDEYDQLSLYGQNDAIGAKFEEYAILIAQAIAARFVLAQAQAIQSAKVVISERGLNFEVNFARKAGLSANAATAWSTVATADPIGDLETLRVVYGRALGRVVISRQAMVYLQQNANIIKLTVNRGSDLPSRVSADDVRSVFSAYDLGNIVVNEQVVTNSAGTLVPLFDADKVIILPAAGPVGRTALGVTSESIRTENGIAAQEAPGLVSGALESDDPSGYNVLVSAIGLPILTDANATAVLDAY